jgi:DNA helicase-2/ATP-dependent DNA helicase PcrA
LAFDYIRKFPEIKDLISARFAYLFIDEMQDTNSKQLQLIESIFDKEKVIIQRIGDENQAIFDSEDEMAWTPEQGYLSISDSKRFSVQIADRVKNICITPQELLGNEDIINIKPIILRFSDGNINKILPSFAKLIIFNGLDQFDYTKFKAVGRIGKGRSDDKLTIGSYYNQYIKNHPKKVTEYNTLRGYHQALVSIEGNNINHFRQILISCLLKSLRLSGIKNMGRFFTEKSLFKHLKDENPNFHDILKRNLAIFLYNKINNVDIYEELKNFMNISVRQSRLINELEPLY